ncbi:protein NRT1/ PTR FAMILY 1.2-like isoform X2 [Nicotiana sylvestris]|uniref:protein NRT1/ PTR FAMILY 1.2-like isoform X2 n=1 Tax=Nicotiana sylvestris TaxID=4096 RepID=UPI0007B9F212|nr:PREDICTED: protein NRT1/ PTR FAMILY 1.2-like isoform X2 [Nicotiana tabacum]
MEKEMLELSSDHMTKMEEDHNHQLSSSSFSPMAVPRIMTRSKGGLVTMPFIIANESLEKVASYGLLPNMTFYLMKDYRMGVTTAQNLLFYWSSATNFLPLVGAFIADSYLGRFLVIGFGSIFSFLGAVLLWLTAMIPKARPSPCDLSVQACKSATPAQYTLLVSSFMLMSIGAGGVRPCSLAFGANQFDKPDNPNNKRVLETFFNWFLNKACIIKCPEDVKQDGVAVDPWNLRTVEQVEDLKSLIRVMPLWSTGIMISINLSQSSFPLLQANSMNRHITKSIEIPAGSFGMFTIIALTIWLVLYDRAILPLASRIRGKPVRLGTRERMGIGIFFSCMAMLISGIIEHIRRGKAIKQGLLNNPEGVVAMSAMWLIPQHCLNGIAEAFNAIGQTEFYYSELPKSMSSIAAAMFGLGMAVANLLASVILSNVDNLTKREGKESWVSSNINRGRYENYYWLLAIMTGFNLLYFMVCSWAYGPCVENMSKKMVEGDGDMPQENVSSPLRPLPA